MLLAIVRFDSFMTWLVAISNRCILETVYLPPVISHFQIVNQQILGQIHRQRLQLAAHLLAQRSMRKMKTLIIMVAVNVLTIYRCTPHHLCQIFHWAGHIYQTRTLTPL